MTATIDVSGLPAPVVEDIQRLVATLRRSLMLPDEPPPAGEESSEERIRWWLAWTASHPHLETVADDSRESIYEGRGE